MAGEEPPSRDANTDDLQIRTFLIADVRGYTLFTQERGDEAAGKLAAKFARIAREVVEGRGGTLLELRGDEALCVFASPRQAIRAAVDLQDRFVEETLADPELPLTVGIGLDAGEAVEVEGGYRGGALNLAARLCGQAKAGEVLASREVTHLARRVDGVSYLDRGSISLKGLDEPVAFVRVVPDGVDPVERLSPYAPVRAPEPRPRRRPRWPAVAAAAAALILIAVVLPRILPDADVDVGSNSIARIDADGGSIELATPLGDRVGTSAIGFGSIWVAQPDQGRVVRVDLEDGEITDTVEVGASPAGVAFGAGSVWVTNAGDGTLTRIDPGTNLAGDPLPAGSRPTGIAFGAGSLWVADSLGGALLRMDPVTGDARAVPLRGQPSSVAFTPDGVWVTVTPAGLVRIDPEDLSITLEQPVGSGPAAVLPAFGSIWVANNLDGTVSRLEPATGRELAKVTVGDGPNSLAASGGSVWVTTEYDGTVTAIDPATGTIERKFPLGAAVSSVSADGAGLWLAVGASYTAHRGGTLSVASEEAIPATLDPALVFDELGWQILSHTNDGLLGFKKVGGPDGTTLVPDLASAFPQISPDGLTYRFPLRDGMKYSTGQPVRPEDFRYGLERALALSGDAASHFGALEGADACDQRRARCDLRDAVVTDEASVTYHLARPDADLPLKLALPFAFPVPRTVPIQDQGLEPVPATGPYRLAESGEDSLRLERNPRFRQWSGAAQPDGFVDEISWKFTQKSTRVFDGLAGDQVDWFADPPPSDELRALEAAHPDQVVLSPQPFTLFVGFDLGMSPVDDARVRRAVNYAIDRDHVVELLGGPTRQRPTCQIIPPNFAGYDRFCPYTLAPERHEWSAPDVHRARGLIRAADAEGEDVTVWITDGLPAGSIETMRYIIEVLEDLGLRPELKMIGASRYFGVLYGGLPPGPSGPPHVYLSGWISDYPGGADFIDSQFRCGANGNASGLCDERLDHRIEEAKQLQTTAPAGANRRWAEIEHDLVDEAVWAPLTNPVITFAFSARTENIQVHPQWGILLSRLWVR